MADELSISESTIKQHLIDLRNKFGADNRTRLAVILVQLRMVNRNRFENGDAPDL
jgi:DNA-binding NarL/FixJ family response regulator